MMHARACARCNNSTLDASGLCHLHRRPVDINSMEYLTRPGNANLLKIALAKMVVEEVEGDADWETAKRHGQVPIEGIEVQARDHTPRYAIYKNRKVRVVGSPRDNVFEIIVDEVRTNVSTERLRFLS